jgi:hypothetical protein
MIECQNINKGAKISRNFRAKDGFLPLESLSDAAKSLEKMETHPIPPYEGGSK